MAHTSEARIFSCLLVLMAATMAGCSRNSARSIKVVLIDASSRERGALFLSDPEQGISELSQPRIAILARSGEAATYDGRIVGGIGISGRWKSDVIEIAQFVLLASGTRQTERRASTMDDLVPIKVRTYTLVPQQRVEIDGTVALGFGRLYLEIRRIQKLHATARFREAVASQRPAGCES